MTTQKCQCMNSDCNLLVALTEEVTREFISNRNWVVIAKGCLGNPPDAYRIIRRSTTYDIYSSDIKSDIEAAIETAEIVNDPEFIEKLRQSIKEMEEGRLIPWDSEELMRE